MFSGLSSLVLDGVDDEAGVLVVRASTRPGPVDCPDCGVATGRVHGYVVRQVVDVPVDGRRVLIRLRIRRMRCGHLGCLRQTFREQPVGIVQRYQRRTVRLAAHVASVARELAGRASARVLAAVGVVLSRQTALRALLQLPLPTRSVPRVIGVDDFALRKRQRYATVIINAETGERVEVLPGRTAEVLEAWLREHPGVEV
ncbi:transposase family protein, partial [Amycolatopsis acidiphila]